MKEEEVQPEPVYRPISEQEFWMFTEQTMGALAEEQMSAQLKMMKIDGMEQMTKKGNDLGFKVIHEICDELQIMRVAWQIKDEIGFAGIRNLERVQEIQLDVSAILEELEKRKAEE